MNIEVSPKDQKQLAKILRGGLDRVLYEKRRPGATEVLDDSPKQRLIAMVCSSPPEGRARWTLHRLHLPTQLRKTMASTNLIESAFSIVEQVCQNVKRWHGGDQRERWISSGLLVAQKQFRRITGYKQIPSLIRELEALPTSKSEVVKRKKAS